jgi:hypothetical protein
VNMHKSYFNLKQNFLPTFKCIGYLIENLIQILYSLKNDF